MGRRIEFDAAIQFRDIAYYFLQVFGTACRERKKAVNPCFFFIVPGSKDAMPESRCCYPIVFLFTIADRTEAIELFKSLGKIGERRKTHIQRNIRKGFIGADNAGKRFIHPVGVPVAVGRLLKPEGKQFFEEGLVHTGLPGQYTQVGLPGKAFEQLDADAVYPAELAQRDDAAAELQGCFAFQGSAKQQLYRKLQLQVIHYSCPQQPQDPLRQEYHVLRGKQVLWKYLGGGVGSNSIEERMDNTGIVRLQLL